MTFALRIASIVVVGSTVVLAGCETAPTSADSSISPNETVRAQQHDPLSVQSISLSQTRYELRGNTLTNSRTGRSMRISSPLVEQLRDVADAVQFRNTLGLRLRTNARVQAIAATRRTPDGAASRLMAERLTAQDIGTKSGAVPTLMASSAQYTCDDVAIAIYDQTMLLDEAAERFDDRLQDMLTSGDMPNYSDVAMLGVLAYDIKMWYTSLTMLATVYAIGGCWNS